MSLALLEADATLVMVRLNLDELPITFCLYPFQRSTVKDWPVRPPIAVCIHALDDVKERLAKISKQFNRRYGR